MAHSSSTTGSIKMWLPVDQLLIIPDMHQNHPQLLCINADKPRNNRRYSYLSWQVTHPPTPVVWSNSEWYKFHHSITLGQPYHKGHQIEVYLTPIYPDTENKSTASINMQIRSTPAVINTSGPGSPHHNWSIQQGTPTGQPVIDAHSSNIMFTQTMVATIEIISQTIVPEDNNKPPPNNQHQNPQHIRDMFNIALG